MSSLYVRDLVRAWAADAGTATGLPFYDTVNREFDPKDAFWSSVEFLTAQRLASTYCADEETGTFDLVFFARGGGGDAPLLQRAEDFVAQFIANSDPARLLTLGRAGPPEDFPAGGGVPWFVVQVPVDYAYHT